MTKRMPLCASLGLMLLGVGSGAVLLHHGRSAGDTTARPSTILGDRRPVMLERTPADCGSGTAATVMSTGANSLSVLGRQTTTPPARTARRAGGERDVQRVTLHVRRTALAAVLREITAQTGITVTTQVHIPAVVLTIDLDNVPVDEALKQLLGAFDLVLLYRGNLAPPRSLAVWIYPPGQGGSALPGDAAAGALRDSVRQAEPAARAHAYEELLLHPDRLPSTVLEDGLRDEDAQVRLRVLAQALVTHVAVPGETLERLALTDSDPQVRQTALTVLQGEQDLGRQQVEHIAEAASRDSDPAVYSTAMELLANLDATRSSETPETLGPVETTEAEDPGQQAIPADPQ